MYKGTFIKYLCMKTGIVVNNYDPTFKNRCQIRVYGLHTQTVGGQYVIIDDDLPWALPGPNPTGAGGVYSVPKVGERVYVDVKDEYNIVYFGPVEMKGPIKDIEYDNADDSDRLKVIAFSEDYNPDGTKDYLQIHPQSACLEILKIHVKTTKHLLHGICVSIFYSCQRRYPWTRAEQQTIIWIVLHNLIDEKLSLRAITYERHISLEHIPQLWKFIHMMTSEFASEIRKAHIIVRFQLRHTILLGIHDHCPELVYPERLASPTDTFLTVQSRSRIKDFLQHDYNQKDGRKNYDKSHCSQQVAKTLQQSLAIIHTVSYLFIFVRFHL